MFPLRYTKSISLAEDLFTIWPIALLFLPIIFSPTIEFVSNANPPTNVNRSKLGVFASLDSNTARIFTTSGTFNDISLSSTLNP